MFQVINVQLEQGIMFPLTIANGFILEQKTIQLPTAREHCTGYMAANNISHLKAI